MKPEMPEKYSAEEWKYLCDRFSKSILKTTEIAELGRNVGISWPFKGSDETPEKYISFSFEELESVPGLIGKKKRVKTLMDVLREILAFDDPFSDMMDTVEKKNTEDRIYHRVLKKLGIPAYRCFNYRRCIANSWPSRSYRLFTKVGKTRV